MAETPAGAAPRVAVVIVSHSRKLAEGLVELAREMAGADVRVVGVGGLALPGAPLGTDPELIRQAIESVYQDPGVIVLLDLGSALLSVELAVELLPEPWRPHVHLADAPLVEGTIAAVVQARLGSSLETVAAEARRALEPKREHLHAEEPPVALPGSLGAASHGQWTRLAVQNPHGLHARPAARLVEVVSHFTTRVQVWNATTGRGPADARSLSALATLDVRPGQEIKILAEGVDATDALTAVSEVVQADGLASRETATDERRSPALVSTVGQSRFRGQAVAPGVVRGKLKIERPGERVTTATPVGEPTVEWENLSSALARVRADVVGCRDRSRQNGDEVAAAIFEAHQALLADPTLIETARAAIVDERVDAAAAWSRSVDTVVARFASVGDPYLAERAADVRDLGQQVLAQLTSAESVVRAPGEPAILIVPELLPSLVSRIDPGGLRGLGAAFGGPTSHGAILARSLRVPVVVGLGAAVLDLADGTFANLDANQSVLSIDPADLSAGEADVSVPTSVQRHRAKRSSIRPIGRSSKSWPVDRLSFVLWTLAATSPFRTCVFPAKQILFWVSVASGFAWLSQRCSEANFGRLSGLPRSFRYGSCFR